jgi:tetratricopeptide (TPR) repeat protein
MVARLKGDLRMAHSLAEEALSLFQEIGDRKNAAWSHFRLARLARACALFEENVAMHKQLGNKEGMSFALMHWAEALFMSQGDLVMVHALLDEGIALSRELDLKDGIELYLNFSAQIALSQGDIATARLLAEEQAAFGRESSDQEHLAEALLLLGHAVAAGHDYAGAHTLYQESLALFRTMGYKMQAEKLIISPRTVNWHLSSIYSKLQVTSRSAATRYAIEHQLV